MLIFRILLILILVLTLHLLIYGQLLTLIPSKNQITQSSQVVTVNLIKPSIKKPQKTVAVTPLKPTVKKKVTVKKKLHATHSLKKNKKAKKWVSTKRSKKSKLVNRVPQKVTAPQVISPKNKSLPIQKIPRSEKRTDAMSSSQDSQRQSQSFQRSQSTHPLSDMHLPQDAVNASSSPKNRLLPKTIFTPPSFQAAYLHNPAPTYPRISKRRGEQGEVLLRVQVTPQGRAVRVNIKQSSGSVRLDKAAQQTVRQWHFVPAQKNGQPISAWVIVPIVFKLK